MGLHAALARIGRWGPHLALLVVIAAPSARAGASSNDPVEVGGGDGSLPLVSRSADEGQELRFSILVLGQLLVSENAMLDRVGATEGFGRLSLKAAISTPWSVTLFGQLTAEGSTLAAEMPWRSRAIVGGGLEVATLKWLELPRALRWLEGLKLFVQLQHLQRPAGAVHVDLDVASGVRLYHASSVELGPRHSSSRLWVEGWFEAAFHTTHFQAPDFNRALVTGSAKIGMTQAFGPVAVSPYLGSELCLALPPDADRPWLRRMWYAFGARVAPASHSELRFIVEYRVGHYFGDGPEDAPRQDFIVGVEWGYFLGL